MYLWQIVFDLSNISLRIPNRIFSAAAPVLIIFRRSGTLTLLDWLIKAALLALLLQGIAFPRDARCYSLLFCWATFQTIAFINLLQVPRLSRVLISVFAADISIAAHFDAGYLALAQGAFS